MTPRTVGGKEPTGFFFLDWAESVCLLAIPDDFFCSFFLVWDGSRHGRKGSTGGRKLGRRLMSREGGVDSVGGCEIPL